MNIGKFILIAIMLSGAMQTMADTQIKISAGDKTLLAQLDDSQTSRDFIATLPRTFSMKNYDKREYYARMENISENGNKIDTFENGDVTYFTGGPSFAVFYAGAGRSSQSGLIRMGKITSPLADFDTLGKEVEMRVEIIK